MPLSSSFFRSRQYSHALEKAKQEVQNKCIDDFKCGPSLTIGSSLLLLGRYNKAQRHLSDLAAEKHQGAKIGSHFTYAGLAFWFDDQPDRAVELWELGLNAGYQSHEGMELPWILLYAAARRPDCFSRSRAKRLIRQKSKGLSESSFMTCINAFVMQQQGYDSTLKKLAAPFQGILYRRSPAVPRILMEFRSQLDFFAGVHALLADDMELFYKQMLACASVTGHEAFTSELLIAECEIQQGPPKWKRKFSDWLRENVKTQPNRRRLNKTGRAKRPS